ncbi:MAG: hypothetical protein AAGA96_18550 [Verrucomicrobiota bacterium]
MSSRISGKQAIVWCIALSLMPIGFVSDRLIFTPRKVDHTRSLKSIAPADVQKMTVSPTGQLHSISNKSTVTDAFVIEQIISLISESLPFQPSHPVSRWECRLEIKTNSEVWTLKLVDTERSGFLAYVDSGQILSSNELREVRNLLEKNAASQPSKPETLIPITPRVD